MPAVRDTEAANARVLWRKMPLLFHLEQEWFAFRKDKVQPTIVFRDFRPSPSHRFGRNLAFRAAFGAKVMEPVEHHPGGLLDTLQVYFAAS